MKQNTTSISMVTNGPVAVVLFIVGVLLLALSVFLFLNKRTQLRSLHTTEALVIDAYCGADEDDFSYTVVEYQVGGETYVNTFNSYVAGREEGSHTTVAYDPDDPTKVYETGFMGYLIPFLAALFGLALSFASQIPQRAIRALAK